MCPICLNPQSTLKKKGHFHRSLGQSRRIQRYRCSVCFRFSSTQTLAITRGQRKPHITQPLFRLLCSGVSQRRIAMILGISKTTVSRRILSLAKHAKSQNALEQTGEIPVFDEMETFEHSKCKPIAIAIAVDEATRRILAVQAASMPAKGHLAKIARKKYGFRKDHRRRAIRRILQRLKRNSIGKISTIKSDECPRYPRAVKKIFPDAVHLRYKGRRGCVVGQGELKRGGRDPLFALNHSCAMVRDNLKRMTRRTWCTTKKIERLQCLLEIYMCFHNQLVQGIRRPRIDSM